MKILRARNLERKFCANHVSGKRLSEESMYWNKKRSAKMASLSSKALPPFHQTLSYICLNKIYIVFKYLNFSPTRPFSSKYFIFKMKSCPLFTRLFHPNVQIYVLRKDDTRGQLLNSEIHGVFNINTSRHLTSSFILWVFK